MVINGTQDTVNVKDGKVGVGVVNPTQSLEVAGNAMFDGNISAGNLGMFRNRIINGNMRVNQRGVNSTVANNAFTFDRYIQSFVTTGGTITMSNLDLTPSDTPHQYGFRNSLRITNTTAPTSISFVQHGQIVEGLNISDFNWGSSVGASAT